MQQNPFLNRQKGVEFYTNQIPFLRTSAQEESTRKGQVYCLIELKEAQESRQEAPHSYSSYGIVK